MSEPENFKLWQVDLPDGTRIERFDLVAIDGRKRPFRFMYQHENTDVTMWGPVSTDGRTRQDSQFVSSKLEDVRPYKKPPTKKKEVVDDGEPTGLAR